ncbi:hypothetical protein SEVIR_7G210250v4 [Setaria viridis]
MHTTPLHTAAELLSGPAPLLQDACVVGRAGASPHPLALPCGCAQARLRARPAHRERRRRGRAGAVGPGDSTVKERGERSCGFVQIRRCGWKKLRRARGEERKEE